MRDRRKAVARKAWVALAMMLIAGWCSARPGPASSLGVVQCATKAECP